MGGEVTTQLDATLRPWRRASGLIATVQVPAMAAGLALVFFADSSTHTWAFVAAAAVVLLDLVQFGLARAALGRVPESFPAETYASLPLDDRDRRLVSLGLISGPVAPMFLLVAMPNSSYFKDHLYAAAIVLIACGAPSFLSLYRVKRHNTWLAVSRIPARPRRSHPRYRDPNAA